MQYYRMIDDVQFKNRWWLRDLNYESEDEVWSYIAGTPIQKPRMNLRVTSIKGFTPLDLTFAEFEIPIGSAEVRDIFNNQEVQSIPIEIDSAIDHFVLVIRSSVDCIDRSKSEFTIWEEDNDIRPDLAGTYCSFTKIVVDPKKLEGVNICRIKNFEVAVIVSELIVGIFLQRNFQGVKFVKV